MTEKPLSRPQKPVNRSTRSLSSSIFLFILIPVIFMILAPGIAGPRLSYQEGDIVTDDVYYNGATTTYTSTILTEEAKAAAAAEVGQIFLVDDTVLANLKTEILGYRQIFEDGENLGLESLRSRLPGTYSNEVLYSMLAMGAAERTALFDRFLMMVETAYSTGVTSDSQDAVRQQIALSVSASSISGNAEVFFKTLVSAMDMPYNKAFDAAATQTAQEEAINEVSNVQVTVQSGERLASRGSAITALQIEALQALGMYHDHSSFAPYIGLLILVGLLVLIGYLYLRYYRSNNFHRRSAWLLGVVFITVLLLCRLISFIEFSDSTEYSLLIGYLLPVPAAAMLLAVLLDQESALLSTAVMALLVGLIMDGNLAYTIVALTGGITAILTATRLNQRSQFVGASLWIILANLVTIISYGLLTGSNWTQIAVGAMFGVVGGLVSAILAMGILPFLEGAFGITTTIRLLELSNSNHPLMKRLMMEAPGTYNHCILVGNLAEAAADAIGANALLVRVASYYHDMGKLKRPQFYIENQRPGENPHDKLQPALSAMIITAHPADSAKMLKEYRFPSEIIDIVEQHHGDSVMAYFYHKATEQATEQDEIKEADYRYKGKKPQTREAALVMLADSVQAAVQSMRFPTAQEVEAKVRAVIDGKIKSGQLSQCALTFEDAERINQSFLAVLSGMNHHRIAYPDQQDKAIEQALRNSQGAEPAAADKKTAEKAQEIPAAPTMPPIPTGTPSMAPQPQSNEPEAK